MQAPHFLFRKHTALTPSCALLRLPLTHVLVVTRLIPTCLCDATGVHTSIQTGKKEVSIANLLKGKGTRAAFPFGQTSS